jgi:hypothetical protein
MAEEQNTPAVRIAAAIAGKKPKALANVFATDVVALADSVPEAERGQVVTDLALGARAAIEGAHNPQGLQVLQQAGDLSQLLEAAGAT